jgi:hypothetical protein
MAADSTTEQGRRKPSEAEGGDRLAGPAGTGPRDALRMALLFSAAALIAIAALGAMLASSPRYDGSPIPVQARD